MQDINKKVQERVKLLEDTLTDITNYIVGIAEKRGLNPLELGIVMSKITSIYSDAMKEVQEKEKLIEQLARDFPAIFERLKEEHNKHCNNCNHDHSPEVKH